jgi:hypothetical protein
MKYKTYKEPYLIGSLAILNGIEQEEAERLERILLESKKAISGYGDSSVKYSACCI